MKWRSWLSNGAVVFVVLATVRLGFWQLSRYEERSAIAAERSRRHGLPERTSLTGPLDDPDYRRVKLQGHYTAAMVATGGIPHALNGYASLGVFEVEDGTRVLVLRGWIPTKGWVAHRSVPKGTQTIEGILKTLDGADDVEPFVDPRTGESLWPLGREPLLGVFSRGAGIPYRSIAAEQNVHTPVVVVLGPELEDLEKRDVHQLPAGGYTTYIKVFHHLEYAVQWFAFAAIAVGLRLWFGWWRRR